MVRQVRSVQRKSTNLSLDAANLSHKRKTSTSTSRVAEEGIAKAVLEEKARRWKSSIGEAICSALTM